MKICQILFSGLGGQAAVVFSLAREFHRRKIEQSFIFCGVEPLIQDNREGQRNGQWIYVREKNETRYLFSSQFQNFLLENQVDSVLCHSPQCLPFLVKNKRSYKIVTVEHTPLGTKNLKREILDRTLVQID